MTKVNIIFLYICVLFICQSTYAKKSWNKDKYWRSFKITYEYGKLGYWRKLGLAKIHTGMLVLSTLFLNEAKNTSNLVVCQWTLVKNSHKKIMPTSLSLSFLLILFNVLCHHTLAVFIPVENLEDKLLFSFYQLITIR